MVSFEENLTTILNYVVQTSTEEKKIPACLNRILAEDIIANQDLPLFNCSAIDGYACRLEDCNEELTEIEELASGKIPHKKITSYTCSKITTGNIIPDGANCVVPLNDIKIISPHKIQILQQPLQNNIYYKGENIKKDQLILKKGTKILSQHIGILSSIGHIRPKVFQTPKVGIISTGTEIIEPDKEPKPSEIRNSSSNQLQTQLIQMGINSQYYGIIPDNEQALYSTIDRAKLENDIILITGGTSSGDYNLIPQLLKVKGAKLIFQEMPIYPGKSVLFGYFDHNFVFNLPGNPISSWILFEVLIKPFIYRMMGYFFQSINIVLPLSESFVRRSPDYTEFIPAKIIDNQTVKPVNYNNIKHLKALSEINAIINFLPDNVVKIEAGEKVKIRLL